MVRSIVAAAGAVLVGGIAFVLLYPVLGVTLWVSLVAAGGAAVLGAFSSSVVGVRAEGRLALNPIVDVGVLRARYFGTLAFALAAGFMIVESFAFGGSARSWIGFAMGVGITIASAAGFAVSI